MSATAVGRAGFLDSLGPTVDQRSDGLPSVRIAYGQLQRGRALTAANAGYPHAILACIRKLDRGEITPQEFFDAWDAEMEEKERLHPGIHDRCMSI